MSSRTLPRPVTRDGSTLDQFVFETPTAELGRQHIHALAAEHGHAPARSFAQFLADQDRPVADWFTQCLGHVDATRLALACVDDDARRAEVMPSTAAPFVRVRLVERQGSDAAHLMLLRLCHFWTQPEWSVVFSLGTPPAIVRAAITAACEG